MMKSLIDGLTAIKNVLEITRKDLEDDKVGLDHVVALLTSTHKILSEMVNGEYQEPLRSYIT